MTMFCRSALFLLTCATCLNLAQAAAGLQEGALRTPSQPSSNHVGDRLIATSTSTIAQDSEPPLLKPGSRGEAVRRLQARLQQLRYYNGTVDASYGEGTKVAVATFQQAMGLTIDGHVGTETWLKLQATASAPTPTPSIDPVVSKAASVAASLLTTPASPVNSAESPLTSPSSLTPNPPKPKHDWRLWAMFAVGGVTGIGVLCYMLIRFKPFSQSQALAHQASGKMTLAERLSSSTVSPSQLTIDAKVEPTIYSDSNGHQALPTLSEAIDHRESSTSSLQETTRLPKINISEELTRDLHHPDPTQRRKTIWELGQRGDSQAIQPLVDLMMDSDSQQRSLILAAISEIGMRSLKPMNRALIISLQDESSDVRKNAIRDLTRIYDQVAQMTQLLGHAANDSDAEVQETARWALSQLNRIRASGGDSGPLLPNTSTQDYLPGDKPTS
jgi:peptidoglycan hydrolase-like protein with peptidoglycan-binding domain